MDSDWSSLHPHLLEKILEKTISSSNYLDFPRLDCVCSSWHSVTKQNKTLWQHVKSSSHLPLLLVPSKDNHYHSLFNATTSEFLNWKLFVPYDKRFAGSSLGYLVSMDQNSVLTLYKPSYVSVDDPNRSINPTTITLPPLLSRDDVAPYEDKADYVVRKTLITADPLVDRDRCVIVVVFSVNFRRKLAYFRLAKDTKWSYILNESNLEDVLYFQGQCYALDKEGNLMSFDITERDSFANLVANNIGYPIRGNSYLVESEGKLLQVRRSLVYYFPNYDVMCRSTWDVKIFEFVVDFYSQRWIEITDLGESALFMGDNTSVSVKASNVERCKPNCIYFTEDHDDSLYFLRETVIDCGVYDVKTRQMSYGFDMDDDILDKMCKRIPIWIVPQVIYET